MTTLREAAQQALEAMLNFPDDISDDMFESITALKAALAEPQSTHSDECYQWHHKCAVAEVERLRAALAEPQTWVCPDAADTHRYDEPGHCEDCGKALIISTEIKGDKERAHGIGGDA